MSLPRPTLPALALVVLGASPALAAPQVDAQTCLSCHSVDGVAQIDHIPIIHGQSQTYLRNALHAYKSGQRSGGTMSIESAPGQGTIVTISLPLDQSPRVDRPVVPVKGRSEGVGRTALVVDDIPEVRSVIARMLRDLGFEVVEAGSGREALSKLAEIEGDLVLVSDVAMKGMSGADLALEAWKDHPELPVVFMSGYTGDRLDERTTRRRGVRFLSKPFTPDELAIKIAEAISERA